MRVTTYRHLLDPTPARVVDTDWDGLVMSMMTARPREDDKRRMGMWSPVALAEGASRSNAAVVAVHALVLDYDGGGSLEGALASLAGCRVVWHTTWSSTAEAPRARMVIALAAPHPGEHWPAVARWALDRWRWADQACKDQSRAYYLPCAGADGSFRAGAIEGEPLDVAHLRVRPRVVARRVPGRQSMRDERTTEVYDPAWRIAAAEQRGARVLGETCKGAVCPQCGDRSVWWAVEARVNPRAMCNHRNSCGWTGSIREVPYGT